MSRYWPTIVRWFKFTLKPPYTIVSVSYQLFGTLPIGIFSQIWTQDSLRHLLGPFLVNFWHMSTFGDSRAIQVLLAKSGVFRKSIFFSMKDWQLIEVVWCLRWAGPWAIWWYHFQGSVTHLGALVGLWIQRFHFLTSLQKVKWMLGFHQFHQESVNRCALG